MMYVAVVPWACHAPCQVCCQRDCSSETLRNVVYVVGWLRIDHKTLGVDKTGPRAMKNVNLSLTSVANEA